jgi:DNA replication protein DnaC
MTSINQSIDQLSLLRLNGFIEALQNQAQDPAYNALPFNDRLAHLISAELLHRKNKKIKTLSAQAKLKYRFAYMEDIDYHSPRHLDKSFILSLAQNHWIEQNQNIILTGATGTGKTYLACALANSAIAAGYPVYFSRINKLFDELRLVRGDGSYLKWMNKLLKMKVLILDDFASSPLGANDLKELLEIIEDRVQIGSLIITSQLAVKEWYQYLSEYTLAEAILDRVVHNAHRIDLRGESLRKLKNKISYPDTKE